MKKEKLDLVDLVSLKKKDIGSDSVVQLNASVLKRLRQARGYTLQDLSALSGLSTSYISRLEGGDRRMNTEILHKLALALGCEAEVFFQQEFKVDNISKNGFSKDVPLYRVISAGAGVDEKPYDVIFMNEPMMRVFRLPQFASDENVFVIMSINDNYAPKFKSGDHLYFKVSDCKIGDFIMIINKDNCLVMGEVLEKESNFVLKINDRIEECEANSIKQVSVLVACIYQ